MTIHTRRSEQPAAPGHPGRPTPQAPGGRTSPDATIVINISHPAPACPAGRRYTCDDPARADGHTPPTSHAAQARHNAPGERAGQNGHGASDGQDGHGALDGWPGYEPGGRERQAHALAEERQRFASDASHRLRTPLAGLRAELEEARLHPEQTDLDDLVGRALRDVDRLESVVGELGRIAGGGTPQAAEREHVDLALLAREEIARRPDRAVVRLALVPGITAHASRAELRQVFAAMLDCARTRCDGTVLVEVRRDGGDAVLTMTAGSPFVGDAARIFTHLDTAGDGTDLGLSVARAIARVHDGSLHVHGAASFTLRLPATPAR
ncbi:sensor histidine kinase [Sphaerisporangium aureirubrum]|uniref:histidine kinase n=1 Tax=Sphaerisporangium aureirubrum TaxID=1544736 RepID=A0ABW1NLM3_9ACTN